MTDSTSDPEGVEPSADAEHESAEVASTQATDSDRHQGLVEDAQVDPDASEADAWQRTWDEAGGGPLDAHDDAGHASDGGIEPTVIAPSALRGHSHDTGPQDEAISSLEQVPEDEPHATGSVAESYRATTPDPAPAARDDSAVPDRGSDDATNEPPELVEPPRQSLRGSDRPDLDDTQPFEGLGAAGLGAAAGAGAGAAGAAAAGSATDARRDEATATDAADSSVATTEATAATETHTTHATDDELTETRAMPATATEPEFEVGDDTVTRRHPTAEERTGSITVDDETARAAATGTPIVLVESPTPPRKKGARGVGFVVVLLSTLVFAALLAVGYLAVGYLFDRGFSLDETLQGLWLRPSWLIPIAVFFVAYWLLTIIVNRAGWWAHVLGGFIVALLAYAGHIGGAFLEAQSNEWDVLSLTSIGVDDLGQLVLAPLSIVTFVLAREVPIWLGGIVARRGRKAREHNRTAVEEFERENAERLAEYEATR